MYSSEPLQCEVCGGLSEADRRIVAEMTDGRDIVTLCDDCRNFVVPLFYTCNSLPEAVRLAQQATRH